MQAHTVERVESWDSRPFSDGFSELHGLADREFSGAVVADGTWLFMLNGRVIGVFEGDIDDFGDADGTVYEAPHPSLALLFSMQERGGETQAKYYTNDTPLSEASETLSDASFTGYIELSENVLSGDYYVVYYGGRSMSAAFVGASEELVTGDEAFERADDEVGLYEVIKTPVNVTQIPDADDEDDADDGPTAGSAAAGASAVSGAAADEPAADSEESDADEAPEPTSDDESPAEHSVSTPTDDDATDADRERPTEASTDGSSDPAAAAEAAGATGSSDPDSGSATDSASPESKQSGQGASDAGASGQDEPQSDDKTPATGKARTGEPDRMFDEEEQWRNAKSVPTLDPEKSESTDGGATRSTSSQSTSTRRSKTTEESTAKQSSGAKRADAGGKTRSTVNKLKRAVKQRDAKLEEAGDRIEDLQAERDDLQDRVASLESERDDLRSQVSDLEAELEAAEQEAPTSEPTAGTDLSPDAALSDTNLFVRYDSKGKATLDGLGPETDPSEVNANLRIDHHTQFDAADTTVDGEDFETFLEASASYRFVSWAVRELPYEIRDSGHSNGLSDLYEAIPAVDRAELDGTVEVDGEDGPVTRTFDVVLRDRMGDPLVVAELNAEREPVTGHEMEDLVDAATTVREGADELSAAMYLTASFFEPAALETASEETGGGGFLSRSDKESFVNVGRKSGYHLCLVEDRNDAFHLTVPEL